MDMISKVKIARTTEKMEPFEHKRKGSVEEGL